MAKTKISEYSTTNSDNTDIENINIAEGCAPSGINNAIRELMVHLKEFQTGASSDPLTVAGTFVASGGATLSGTNTLSGANVISGNINSSGTTNTFSGGNIFSGTNTISGSAIISGNINSSGTNTFSGTTILSGANTVALAAGAVGTPSLYANGDTNTGIFFPAADTIAFAEGGAEAMRIDSSGNVLIGKTSATANGGDLQVSKGISFPATQSAQSDANTLDDYEQGTFTPTVSGSTSAGVGTYSVQVGRYTKIGNLVTVQVFVNWTAHTGTGDLQLTNLPFPAINVTNYYSSAAIGYAHTLALTANNVVTAAVFYNTSYLRVFQYPVGGGSSTDVPIDTSASVMYTVSYETTN